MEQNLRRYPTYATKLFDAIEAEHPEYYDLPVKEKNVILKEISERIMEEEQTDGRLS